MGASLATQNHLLCIWANAWPKVLVCAYCGSRRDILLGLVAILFVGLSTVLAGCRGSAYFSLGHQPKTRNCFLNYCVANWTVNYLMPSENFRNIPGMKSRLLTRFPSWPA